MKLKKLVFNLLVAATLMLLTCTACSELPDDTEFPDYRPSTSDSTTTEEPSKKNEDESPWQPSTQVIWTIRDLGNGEAALTGYDTSGPAPKGNVRLPESVSGRKITEIAGWSGIKNCTTIEKLTIPGTVSTIGNCAFENCNNLKELTLENGVISIAAHAFDGCNSLQKISLPNTIIGVGDYAFARCTSLKTAVLPNWLTSVSQGLFLSCESLESVYIPAYVAEIQADAFGGCKNLKNVYYGGTPKQWLELKIDGDGNGYLTAATVHYQAKPSDVN